MHVPTQPDPATHGAPQPSSLPQVTPAQEGVQVTVQPDPGTQAPPHESEAPQVTPPQAGVQSATHPDPRKQGFPHWSRVPHGMPLQPAAHGFAGLEQAPSSAVRRGSTKRCGRLITPSNADQPLIFSLPPLGVTEG